MTVCTRGRGAAVITVGQKDCACVHRRGGFRDRLPSHGRGICFYRVGDYQIAPLPPQGGKGRCARWAQDIIACDTAERIIFTIVAGSGSGKLCWHSRGTDNDQENAGYVRENGQRRTGVAPAGAGWGVSCSGTSNFLLLSKESYQRKPLRPTV